MGVFTFWHQDNWAGRVGDGLSTDVVEQQGMANGVQAVLSANREHDCEWLVRALFSFTQADDCFVVGRITHQVVAADALDSDDHALLQRLDGL